MTLESDARKICNRLARYGWRDLLLHHGLDITAKNLGSELLRNLPKIDRNLEGFNDFSPHGVRGIEPGNPSRSLLFHSMASPGVTKDSNGKNLGSFPTLAEIEKIENYVYGIKPPTVEELKSRVRKLVTDSKDIELAAVMFASDYRPGAETVHKYHADVCFSRTGVARVGTKEPFYNSQIRSFETYDKNQEYAFRVLPAKYSGYISAKLSRSILRQNLKNAFGPLQLKLRRQSDETRFFWVPIHKLFNGSECVKGFNLKISYSAHHVNEKLKRIHLYLDAKKNVLHKLSTSIINNPPFRFTRGIAEISTKSAFGSGLLVPIAHRKFVKVAKLRNKFVTFDVPPNHKNEWSPSYQIKSIHDYRHAPEFVHARHKIVNGKIIYFNTFNKGTDPAKEVRKGNYSALQYVDFTGDGWIEISCPTLEKEFHRVPAYSLVTSPDFFPAVDQADIIDWYINQVPKSLQDSNWYNENNHVNALLALSDERYRPNIEHNVDLKSDKLEDLPFNLDDDSVSAIVSLPTLNSTRSKILGQSSTIRHTYLPDGASGVFAPGWDISLDKSRGRTHLAAYGLGSPFPEDVKLCAGLSSFWPAVAPDSGRSFWWPNGEVHPTISPLTDEEIGQVGNLPWDGFAGPKMLMRNKSVAEYSNFDFVDYVESSLKGKFTSNLTAKIHTKEYKARILAIAKAYNVLGKINSKSTDPKSEYSVLSFRKLIRSTNELKYAQRQARIILHGDIYRIEFFKAPEPSNRDRWLKKIMIKIEDRYVFFVGDREMVLVRNNNADWLHLSFS